MRSVVERYGIMFSERRKTEKRAAGLSIEIATASMSLHGRGPLYSGGLDTRDPIGLAIGFANR